MCKVYTDVGGIKYLYHVCPPVRKIIHSLKLVDYLHVQADNPWYNYYITYLALTQLFPVLISHREMYTLSISILAMDAYTCDKWILLAAFLLDFFFKIILEAFR